ncbi:MAG: triple tyrosine motif-containing protein [Balneolaceae bacterium]
MLHSQGLFHVQEYDPQSYNNFRQNWAIEQDSSGYLYFGNSAGLIQFNGAQWRSIHLPSQEIVRSLHFNDSRMYVGGNMDFGYLVPDSLNQFQFQSLRNHVDSLSRDFSHVWHVLSNRESIFFSTYEGVFVQNKEDSITAIQSRDEFGYLFKVDGQLIVTVREEGLAWLKGIQTIHIPGSDIFADDPPYVALPLNGEILFVSRKQGFVRFDGKSFKPFNTDVKDYVNQHQIYRGIYINDSEIALATLTGGIVIINTTGEWMHTINEEYGLPTDIIYNLYLDSEQLLWAATDNGLAKIHVNDPVTRYDDRNGLGGIPLFIEEMDSRTYIGTTEGLFRATDNHRLKQVSEIQGRVYAAISLQNRLLISADTGTFAISNDSVAQIHLETFPELAVSKNGQDEVYGIHQQTIYRINIMGNHAESKSLAAIDSHIFDIYADSRDVWAAAAGRKVFRISLSDSTVQTYDVELDENLELKQIGYAANQIRLATDDGLFVFNREAERFEKDSTFADPEMVTEQVFRFEQCSENEIWFRNDRRMKKAILKNNRWEMIEDPYRGIARDEAVEVIHCHSDGSIWFGGSQALYHLSDPEWTYEHDFNTNITGLLVHNDLLVYGGYGTPKTNPRFSFSENELRFTYAAASYINPEANTYRTRLRGYEDDWSSWTNETQKDYTFIPEGTYTFEVQGRNIYNRTGTTDTFTFTVLPPWYRTVWAWIGYVVVMGLMIYTGYRVRIRSILREQRIRDDIARDLHDELSSTLSSIHFFASAIEDRNLSRDKAARFLSLISKSSNEAKEKISDIVWVIHSGNDNWENLLFRCKRFASDVLEARNITQKFVIKGYVPGKTDLRIRKNIWLIFREMITNIARHSGASEVETKVAFTDNAVIMSVSDNGKGFIPPKADENGHGLQNIADRTEQLKGSFSLKTAPGKGTLWEITIPV